jgi:DNA-binding transcriptional regulator YiaG
MSNIATLLKSEIVRLARKEVKAEVAQLRKASAAHRSEIAALKRRLAQLEGLANRAGRRAAREPEAAASSDAASDADGSVKGRFSAKSMRSQRRRLGLSAAEMGLLVGSSAQSVYNWEEGKTRPQARHLQAIFGLRSLGRRQARTRLEALAPAG